MPRAGQERGPVYLVEPVPADLNLNALSILTQRPCQRRPQRTQRIPAEHGLEAQ